MYIIGFGVLSNRLDAVAVCHNDADDGGDANIIHLSG